MELALFRLAERADAHFGFGYGTRDSVGRQRLIEKFEDGTDIALLLLLSLSLRRPLRLSLTLAAA